MTEPRLSITIIAGPTASGKSGLAEKLATQKNSIIINADALQIYDALPILTAQPDAIAHAAFPHALYGVYPPDQICNAATWGAMVTPIIRAAWDKGQHPIVVGGTGLYLKSLISGLSPIPDIPDDIRCATRELHAKLGNPAFHGALAAIDPVVAERLKPNDSQRLMRAYEVMRATGTSLVLWQEKPGIPPLPDASFHTILVDGAREILRTRAEKRLQQMITGGVLDEVRAFHQLMMGGTLRSDAPPTRALGYHSFVDHLEGRITLDHAIKAAHLETCQYIKRQQTWFRHQMTFDETITIG